MINTTKIRSYEVARAMLLAGLAPARLDAEGNARPLTEIRGSVGDGKKCIGPRNPLTYVYGRVDVSPSAVIEGRW